MTITTPIIGIAWYRAEDYSAIRRIMTDRHKLAESFDIWRREAEQAEQRLRRDGHTVVRAFIDPKTFPDWCRARGLDINAQARMAFANTVAHEHAQSGLH